MFTAPERIVVVGTSCAGKSVFARKIADLLGHPHIELDELFWGPNWTPKTEQEFRNLTAQAAEVSYWVAAGNYSAVQDVLWPRATTIIWLNYSFVTVLIRAIRRTIRRNVTGEVLWHGNRESFRQSFLSKESILVWVVTTFHPRRKRLDMLRASCAYPHLSWLEFRRPAEATKYFRFLEKRIIGDRP
ncbi:MAG: hypothetical protein HY306_05825 [Nitrosomonadales bacterium]|nr:hypothetical protein [Nitrosomonadales bacterium]